MTTENIDVQTTLSGKDQLSPTLQKIYNDIKRLEKQLANLGKSPIAKDPVNALARQYSELQKGEIRRRMNWARSMRDAGKLSEGVYKDLRVKVSALNSEFERTGRFTAKQHKEFRRLVGMVDAFRSVHNQSYKERESLEHRLGQKRLDMERAVQTENTRTANKQAAHLKREEAAEHRAHNASMRAATQRRREVYRYARAVKNNLGRAINRLDQPFFTSPLFYGAVAGGAAIRASRGLVRSAAGVDTAEAMARVNTEFKQADLNKLRKSFVLPQSVALGIKPAELINTITEAAKAGMPENLAPQYAEMVVKLSKALNMPIDQVNQNLAYGIQTLMGSGKMGTGFKAVEQIGNISGFLASKMAANPSQMFAFTRRGLGAGASFGMDIPSTLAFGAAVTSEGAQGAQAARFLAELSPRIAGLKRRFMTIAMQSGRRTPEQLDFLQLPGKLGYGSYSAIERSFKEHPDTALFDLLKSFGKIKDTAKRANALHDIFGGEFGPYLLALVNAPGTIDKALKLARKQAKDNSFDSKGFEEWRKTIDYNLDVISSSFEIIKANLGHVFAPYLHDFAVFFSHFSLEFSNGKFGNYIKSFLDGLINGLGFKSLPELLEGIFGKPGQFNPDTAKKIFKFAKGFAEGLMGAFNQVAAALKHIPGFKGDAEAIGKLVGEIFGLSIALHVLRPVISVFGAIIGFVTGLAHLALFFKSLLPGASSAAAAKSGPSAGIKLFGKALPPGLMGALPAITMDLGDAQIQQSVHDSFSQLTPAQKKKLMDGQMPRGVWDKLSPETKKSLQKSGVVPPGLIHKESFSSDSDHPWSAYIHNTAFRDIASNTGRLNASLNSLGSMVRYASLSNAAPSIGMGSTASRIMPSPVITDGGIVSGPHFGLAPDGLPGLGKAPDLGLSGHSGYSGHHHSLSHIHPPVPSMPRHFQGRLPKAKWWTPEREAYAVNRLMKEAGLSRAGAVGLVSRWKNVEAAAGPWSVNRASGAIGIEQDLGVRKRGVVIGDYKGQVTHAIQQLNSTERRAANVLRHAKTHAEGAIGASMYERAENYNARTGADDWTGKSLAGAAGVDNDVANLIAGVPQRTVASGAGHTSHHAGGNTNVNIHIHGNNSDPEALAHKVQENLMRHMNRRQHDIELEQT